MTSDTTAGPLKGVTVIEMAGLGPAPLAALMLAEMGARVLRIERKNDKPLIPLDGDLDYNRHGRSILKVDLKDKRGCELVLDLVQNADILIEGFRPSVMERLGLGPEVVEKRNPRLIYGRVTGFGQEGPLAQRAGHDLTYLAYSGILNAIGLKGSRPTPPLNLVADYGGGTMFLIAGVLPTCSIQVRHFTTLTRPRTDCMLRSPVSNHSSSPNLPRCCHWTNASSPASMTGRSGRPCVPKSPSGSARGRVANGQNCSPRRTLALHPVLSFAEAQTHPHNVARATHVQAGRLTRPAPAPRLSRTAFSPLSAQTTGDAVEILAAFGVATDFDGTPLILVSMLAAHTQALIKDPRCSLLLGEPGKGDPLAHPRISLSCRAERLEPGSEAENEARRRYLNRNPKAELYAGLGDFHFFRLAFERASLNGGFGRAYLLEASDLLSPVCEGLAETEQGALEHMNADHLDATALYAKHFAKLAGDGWKITGFDAEGIDLASDDKLGRVWFSSPLAVATSLRVKLVEMAKTARQASPKSANT